MKLTTIRINNAKFYAYHGDHEYEREFGNQFEVDIEMQCYLQELEHSDKLVNTVDYLLVYKSVRELFQNSKFYLVETVNMKICEMILEKFSQVMKIKCAVRKKNAPLGIIDSVEVVNELERKI